MSIYICICKWGSGLGVERNTAGVSLEHRTSAWLLFRGSMRGFVVCMSVRVQSVGSSVLGTVERRYDYGRTSKMPSLIT